MRADDELLRAALIGLALALTIITIVMTVIVMWIKYFA